MEAAVTITRAVTDTIHTTMRTRSRRTMKRTSVQVPVSSVTGRRVAAWRGPAGDRRRSSATSSP